MHSNAHDRTKTHRERREVLGIYKQNLWRARRESDLKGIEKNSHSRIFSAMENRICILFFIIIVIASKVNGSTQSTYEACQILMTSQPAADLNTVCF